MGELGALFNPGMRHELEERRARAARREEEGNARDGDLRIDLDSGVAIINSQDEDESDPAGSPSTRSGPSDAAGADSGATEAGAAEPGGADVAGSLTEAGSAETEAGAPDAEAVPADAEAGAPEESNPAPLRPRGKRAMTATRR